MGRSGERDVGRHHPVRRLGNGMRDAEDIWTGEKDGSGFRVFRL